jgi:hypothetical protein
MEKIKDYIKPAAAAFVSGALASQQNRIITGLFFALFCTVGIFIIEKMIEGFKKG